MEKYFFLQTIHEKGNTRVRAISNQTIPTSMGASTGDPVDTSLNVACDKAERTKHEVGTVFVCEQMYKTSGFYKVNAGKITALTEIDASHPDHDEIMDAYMRVTGGSSSTKKTTKKSAPKPASLIDKLMKTKALAPPKPEEGFFVDKDVWYYLLRNLALNKNTMLIGPTGTGKTELISHLCKVAERDMNVLDMGAMQDPISGLLGVHRLEGDESVFDQSAFTQYVQEDNVIVLDEISRAPSTANNILFPCLDSRRELPLEIASSKAERSIALSEDVCFFATANLGAEYTGTQTLDRALIDRFSLVELDYMPKDIESKVLQNRVKVGKYEADMICDLAKTIRSMHGKGDLSTPISTRHTLEIAGLVKDGFDISKSFEFILFPMFEGSKTEGERSTLYSLLTSR